MYPSSFTDAILGELQIKNSNSDQLRDYRHHDGNLYVILIMGLPSTLLLRRSDIVELIDLDALYDAMRSAFKAYSAGESIPTKRFPSDLGNGTAMVLGPGVIKGIPAYSVKVHAKFPKHPPAIKGVLLLHDLSTGNLLAVMDSSYLTAVRTGFCAAMASHLLGRQDAKQVAVIGAGVQGEFHLRYLSRFRELESIKVFDLDNAKALRFAKRLSVELSLQMETANSVETCVAQADIIVTATWATQPFIFRSMLAEGAHITTLGPDQPDKCEVDASIIKDALFVCDDRKLAVTMGAIAGANLTAEHIHAELGEVLAGTKQGRRDDKQITVYGSVGLAFQDLVVGWQVYQAALEAGLDRRIDFLA